DMRDVLGCALGRAAQDRLPREVEFVGQGGHVQVEDGHRQAAVGGLPGRVQTVGARLTVGAAGDHATGANARARLRRDHRWTPCFTVWIISLLVEYDGKMGLSSPFFRTCRTQSGLVLPGYGLLARGPQRVTPRRAA